MLLTIDIGNTNITFGLYNNNDLEIVSRLETKGIYDYLKEVIDMFKPYSLSDITDIVISSVVPKVLEQLLEAIKSFYNGSPLIVNHKLKLDLNIKIDNPEILGSDFIATAVAACKLYHTPVAIFDFGTATKFSVVDENCNFLGCGITSGMKISMDSLFSSTAKLSEIELMKPESVIGANTENAIGSGIIFGSAAFVDGIAERIKKELGIMPTLVLTGGFSEYVYGNTLHDAILAPNLILDGLKTIYELNIKSK